MVRTKTVKGDKREFLTWFFEMLNLTFVNKLTPMEIEIISEFLMLDKPIYKYDPFSSRSRKKVREIRASKGHKMSHASLNNIVKGLKEKRLIHEEDDGLLRFNKHIKQAVDKAFSSKGMELHYKYEINDSRDSSTGSEE